MIFWFCFDYPQLFCSNRLYSASAASLAWCIICFLQSLSFELFTRGGKCGFEGVIKESGRWDPGSLIVSPVLWSSPRERRKVSPPHKHSSSPGSPSYWKAKLGCHRWLTVHVWTRQTQPVPALWEPSAWRPGDFGK